MVNTPLEITEDAMGDPIITINSSHTYEDIAKYFYEEGGAEELIFCLEAMLKDDTQ